MSTKDFVVAKSSAGARAQKKNARAAARGPAAARAPAPAAAPPALMVSRRGAPLVRTARSSGGSPTTAPHSFSPHPESPLRGSPLAAGDVPSFTLSGDPDSAREDHDTIEPEDHFSDGEGTPELPEPPPEPEDKIAEQVMVADENFFFTSKRRLYRGGPRPDQEIAVKAKRQRLEEAREQEWPATYRTHSERETVMFEYVEHFRRQFAQLFQHRPKLLLTPPNECGCEKFVCTTVRPTHLRYEELYRYDGCAKFVADHITYEPLERPTLLPRYVPSPASVLTWQVGDCFDMSILLTSLLLGVGFDAYCVSGYATRELTLNDTSTTVNPELEVREAKAEEAEKADPPKYVVQPKMNLDSKFLQRQAETEARIRAEEAERLRAKPAPVAAVADPMHGKRLHCWVLVKAGRRGVDEDFFLEPTIGRRFPLRHPQYLGVESVWNHEGYYVNIQEVAIGNLKYDLNNQYQWETLFLDEPDDLPTADEGAAKAANETEFELDLDPKAEARRGKPHAAVMTVPPSWVDPLELPYQKYETRYPNGHKRSLYHRCVVQKFAPFYRADGMISHITLYADNALKQSLELREEFHSRRDLMDRRVCVYKPERPADEYFIEYFKPGREGDPFGLASLQVVGEGVVELTRLPEKEAKAKRTRVREYRLEFFAEGRRHTHDGLKTRYIKMSERMEETFDTGGNARDDGLVHRTVNYEYSLERMRATMPMDFLPDDDVMVKMTETFARNPEVDAREDVHHRIYKIKHNEMEEIFHLGKGDIVPTSINYVKHSTAATVNLKNPPPMPADFKIPQQIPQSLNLPGVDNARKDKALYQRYIDLLNSENECGNAITASRQEMKAIIDSREKDRARCFLDLSVYDTMRRAKGTTGEKSVERVDESTLLDPNDIIAPFIRGKLPETKEEAEAVKESVLTYFKGRTITKATLIRKKIMEAKREINSREEEILRNADHTPEPEVSEFQREKIKRELEIKVMKTREEMLHRSYKRKFKDLRDRLWNHPILGPLLSSTEVVQKKAPRKQRGRDSAVSPEPRSGGSGSAS